MIELVVMSLADVASFSGRLYVPAQGCFPDASLPDAIVIRPIVPRVCTHHNWKSW